MFGITLPLDTGNQKTRFPVVVKANYDLGDGGSTPHDTLLIDEIDLWGVDATLRGKDNENRKKPDARCSQK
ncbi:MAG: hypothetical protein CVU43_14660 [Chloroflexi bacterium HGW-Chloroflexi-5]|nr:MAG: hypothetical protein CVU43_14660 [Chloroflexi bacterium HGW-Chloroflexi-5]